jgi:WD40 repeat protein
MSAYVRLHDLSDGHSDSVTCLAFSPGAEYLASGAGDNSVVLWHVQKGILMYQLLFEAAVSCLVWHPLRADTIICGLQNGTIYQASGFSLVYPLADLPHSIHDCVQAKHVGFDINIGVKGQVHCLAYDEHRRYLAIGLGETVYLTKESDNGGSTVTCIAPTLLTHVCFAFQHTWASSGFYWHQSFEHQNTTTISEYALGVFTLQTKDHV